MDTNEQVIANIAADFEQAWQSGHRPVLQDFLSRVSDDLRSSLLQQLVPLDAEHRQQAGEAVSVDDYRELCESVGLDPETLGELLGSEARPFDVDPGRSVTRTFDPSSTVTYISSAGIGVEQRGRYRLDRILGEGQFGRVYLGYDEELQRQVAIKVPTQARFQRPEDAETYLAEARTVAALDHPHIVPVYDMGRTDDGSVYVVSRYVAGTTLEGLIRAARPPHRESAQLVATLATTLHHAHQKRLIHRDIKPANILIDDASGTPFVADFGLAVREEDYLKQTGLAGTPAYMSPEQARGEGHRLDGRSDLFSLGVILYELLTGKRPFRGSSVKETLQLVVHHNPQPPRELDDMIPAELERICLKSLSKRASDRYTTGAALAEDLQEWLKPTTVATTRKQVHAITPRGLRSFTAEDADFFLDLLPGPRNRDGLPESIAFWKQRIEQRDPEQTFSVGLLYGPSGCGKSSLVKAGLIPNLDPAIMAIYIEATPEETELRLLRGLRRRLPDMPEGLPLPEFLEHIRRGSGPKVVLIIDQFEQWLYSHRVASGEVLPRALRQCDGGRLQAILMIRDDFYLAAARLMNEIDVPIVTDKNFKLVDLFDVDHAQDVLIRFGQAYRRLPENSQNLSSEQIDFIRQVVEGLSEDGKVVSVRLALLAEMLKSRDWVPATLETIGGLEGIGISFLEETFASHRADARHRQHQEAVRGVLRALLPESGTNIKGAMRSEEDLLEASGYRNRPTAFRELLRILDGELRLVTPTDPEGILKSEARRGKLETNSVREISGVSLPTSHFQLTHDYLVPSLREWLTRKQRETKKGRAELKLAERAGTWSANPENKQLPTFWEWLTIRRLTEKAKWRPGEQALMRRASRFHLTRCALMASLLWLIGAAGWWTWDQVEHNRQTLLAEKAAEQEVTRIEGLVGRLVDADPNQILEIVAQLSENQQVADIKLAPLLTPAVRNNQPLSTGQKRAQLHARMAAVASDPSLVDLLLEELLTGKVTYIGPIRELLKPYTSQLSERCWSLLADETANSERRFRAALVLADYTEAADSYSWSDSHVTFAAQQLVSTNAEYQPVLRNLLRPIRTRLLPDLKRIFEETTATDAQRLSAANAFADYASDDIEKLSSLLVVATSEQHAVLYPLVAANPTPAAIDDLKRITASLPPDDLGSVPRIAYGQRRANAAVTLLRLGEREKVLPVFEWSDDPEALTQFIFRCKPRGIGVEPLLDLLDLVAASSDRYPRDTRYALMLAIGEFAPSEIPQRRRASLVDRLADWYANDPSSGVHGASGWLLRHLGEQEIVARVDQTPVPYSPNREWFTLAITVTPTIPPQPKSEPTEDSEGGEANAESGEATTATETDKENQPPTPSLPAKTFYYTFIVFLPGESLIGSPNDELERDRTGEILHSVKLTRPFALLDREITWLELIAFKPYYINYMQQSASSLEAAGAGADWYDSVGFCRWLGAQMGLLDSNQPYSSPESLDKETYPREPTLSANWAPKDWPLNLDRCGFRLPTDAEWEVATRGGTRTAYFFGGDADLLARFGWFMENSGKQMHPSKELRPSSRGLFDLHGNLYEWTHDWSKVYGPESVTDPVVSSGGGAYRVARGGGPGSAAAGCRTASRFYVTPWNRGPSIGFRPALSLSSQASVEPESGEE